MRDDFALLAQQNQGINDHWQRFTFTKTTIAIQPETSLEAWMEVFSSIKDFHAASQFWLGDLLLFAEQSYGEEYTQVLDETDMEYHVLASYKWVAGKVKDYLRKESLTWSHHKEVAKLEPEEQDYWLNEAVEQGYSVRGLRDAIRDEGQESAFPEGWCVRHSVVCPLEV